VQPSQSDQILQFAQRQGLLRAADIRAQGWSPQLLIKLHRTGKLERVARGLYCLATTESTEHQVLMEVCKRVPKAVICLLSALQFQDIGTQQPHEVWIALPEATQTPRLDYPPLRVARLRGDAYSSGIETTTTNGNTLRVYNVAKTVTDCFKFRHKIGLDVALQALKEAWRARKLSMDEVTRFARINRVEKVMQPYLESLVA
jgi:predicted transcriptional regulator of viral defense system